MTIPRHDRQHVETADGFMLVEVIVSALIIAIIAVGLGTAMRSSSSAITVAKIREHEAAITEGALEQLRANTTWTTQPACATSVTSGVPCDLQAVAPGIFDPALLADTAGQVTYALKATAVGIDDASDGTGTNDADGVIPDYFRIQVTVTQNRLAMTPPYESSYDLDPQSRFAFGTLNIRVCAITPQIDERSPIAACPDRSAHMKAPIGWNTAAPGSCTTADCSAYTCAIPETSASFCAGATAPFTPGSAGDVRHVNIDAHPVVTPFVVRGVDSNTSSVQVSGVTGGDGSVTVKRLIPGKYSVTVTPPTGYRLWTSHSLPAGGFASVEAGLASRTVQLLQPVPAGNLKLSISETDDSVWYAPVTYSYLASSSSASVDLTAAPQMRIASASVTGYAVKTNLASPGPNEFVFTSPITGLYAATVSGGWALTRTPGFVWIDPDGTTIPPTGNPVTQGLASRTICFSLKARTAALAYAKAHGIPIPNTLSSCPQPPKKGGGKGGGGGGGGGTPTVSTGPGGSV